ncbi:MAG: hypothetical protein WC307_04880 [Candidatus Nanoarchaeia archaeon]|jgi:GTPase SAR1 family protein
MNYFGLSNNNDVSIYKTDDAISAASAWADINNAPLFKSRLEGLISKVKIIENTQAVLSESGASKNMASTDGVNLYTCSLNSVFWDLGGQNRFRNSSLYDTFLLPADGVLFLMDNSNSIVATNSNLVLDQLREICENKSPKKSYSYGLSKSDLSYLTDKDEDGQPKNRFALNFDKDFIARYEKADMLMPICNFSSWDNDGVIASIGSMILQHVTEGGINLKFVVGGDASVGKSTLLERFVDKVTNKPDIIKPTKMTIGSSYKTIEVNSAVYYAHDNDDRMYFVNGDGQVANLIKVVSYNDKTGGIKKFNLLDANGELINNYVGGDWGKIISYLKDNNSTPVYDLKVLSRIAQFMNPLEQVFPDKESFIGGRLNDKLNGYLYDLSEHTDSPEYEVVIDLVSMIHNDKALMSKLIPQLKENLGTYVIKLYEFKCNNLLESIKDSKRTDLFDELSKNPTRDEIALVRQKVKTINLTAEQEVSLCIESIDYLNEQLGVFDKELSNELLKVRAQYIA